MRGLGKRGFMSAWDVGEVGREAAAVEGGEEAEEGGEGDSLSKRDNFNVHCESDHTSTSPSSEVVVVKFIRFRRRRLPSHVTLDEVITSASCHPNRKNQDSPAQPAAK